MTWGARFGGRSLAVHCSCRALRARTESRIAFERRLVLDLPHGDAGESKATVLPDLLAGLQPFPHAVDRLAGWLLSLSASARGGFLSVQRYRFRFQLPRVVGDEPTQGEQQ